MQQDIKSFLRDTEPNLDISRNGLDVLTKPGRKLVHSYKVHNGYNTAVNTSINHTPNKSFTKFDKISIRRHTNTMAVEDKKRPKSKTDCSKKVTFFLKRRNIQYGDNPLTRTCVYSQTEPSSKSMKEGRAVIPCQRLSS